MKILISTVLLSIMFILHLKEMNAMNRKAGSSVRRSRGVPRGELVNGCKVVKRDPEDGEPTTTIFFGMKPIQLWLDESRTTVRKAYFPNCRIPYGQFCVHNNFLIRYANLEGIILVAFVSQQAKLIGVRTPESITGQKALKPTPTEWYIHYFHKNFKLAVNPATKTVYAISLLPRNQHNADHGTEPVDIAGITFKVFRDKKFNIMGAELERPYIYNVG